MPVLPAVPSTRVAPGRMSPLASAGPIMRRPIRSLTEPPGFMHSSFRRSSQGPVSRCWALTMGVLPMSSRTFWWTGMGGLEERRNPPWEGRGFYQPGRWPAPERVRQVLGRRRPDEGGRRRPAGTSVLPLREHARQAVLGVQLFLLHPRQRGVVHGKDAQLGIQDLLVQLPVPVIELPELRVALHQRVEFVLWLPFKHRFDLLRKRERPG